MTVLALFLLLIILFLVSYLYLSHLNPHDVTLYLLPDQSLTASAALVLIGCILLGLVLGYLIHLYSAGSHFYRSWKRERAEKRGREATSLYRAGVARLRSDDLKKAHELLRRAEDLDPARTEVLVARAEVELRQGEGLQASETLLRAKALEPRNLEVLFDLAAVFETLGRGDDARRTWEEILEIDRDNLRALRALRDRDIAEGRWREALETTSRLLKAAPAGAEAQREKDLFVHLRHESFRLLLDENRSGEAQAALLQLVQEVPDFVPARVSLGEVYRLQERREEAARTWQEGYRRLRSAVFLARLEDLCAQGHDPASTLAFYSESLARQEDDLTLRLFFGRLCLRLEMSEEAMEHLSFIERSGADFAQLHLLLAEVHALRERTDESIAAFRRALGGESRLRIAFTCGACGAPSPDWRSRCPDCGAWGKLDLAERDRIRASGALQPRPSRTDDDIEL